MQTHHSCLHLFRKRERKKKPQLMFWCFKSVIGWCRIKTHYRLLWAVIGRYSSQTHCTTHVVPYDAQIEQIQFGLFKNTPRVHILLQSTAFWTPHHRWKPFASGTVGPVSSTTLSAVSLFFWSNQAYSKCGWDDKSSGIKYWLQVPKGQSQK